MCAVKGSDAYIRLGDVLCSLSIFSLHISSLPLVVYIPSIRFPNTLTFVSDRFIVLCVAILSSDFGFLLSETRRITSA